VTVGAVVTVGETVAPVEVEALVGLGELEALQAPTSANTDKTARAATRLISTSPLFHQVEAPVAKLIC
jgi:hypothetical protein